MPPTPRTGVTTDPLNLRAGPGVAFHSVQVLPAGVQVAIIDEQGDWLQVLVGSTGGFVHRAFVRIEGAPPTRTGTTTAALNLRAGPGTNFDILTTLAPGVNVTIQGQSGEWLQVQSGGRSGFVHGAFILEPGQTTSQGFLKDQPELFATTLAPATAKSAAGGSDAAATAARIWNLYGGLLAVLAAKLNIDPGVAVAVVAAESGGEGFGRDGRLLIRFENHVFWDQWGRANASVFNERFVFNADETWKGHQFRANAVAAWQDVHVGSQAREWAAFEVARDLNDRAAKLSISMGLPQIMGFNFASIGYESVAAMFDAFSRGLHAQLIGMFDFIQSPHPISERVLALRRLDFLTFAAQYNGSGQAPTYSAILQQFFDGYRQLR